MAAWRNLHLLPDFGEATPREPHAEPVDGLERVQAAALQHLAAAELLEDLQLAPVRPVFLHHEVTHEVLQRLADADQGHGLARFVDDERQAGVLLADLAQDGLGERGHLGHGQGGESACPRAGDVPPGRVHGHGFLPRGWWTPTP